MKEEINPRLDDLTQWTRKPKIKLTFTRRPLVIATPVVFTFAY